MDSEKSRQRNKKTEDITSKIDDKPKKSEPELDILTLMGVMDVANKQIRENDAANRALDEHFDVEAKRAEIKDALRKSYEGSGINPTEEQLDIAIDAYASSLYEFKEPEQSLAYKVATMYADRARVTRKYSAPVGALILGTALVTGVVIGGQKITTQHAISAVETRIEELYKNTRSLDQKLVALSSAELTEQERAQMQETISSATKNLQTAKVVLDKLCPEGSAEQTVREDNYKSLNTEIETVETAVQSAKSYVAKGEQAVKEHNEIAQASNSLEALIVEIRNSNAPETIKSKAETEYTAGRACIEKRLVDQEKTHYQKLLEFKSDAQQLASIPSEAEKHYSSIKSIAKEQNAVTTANSVYTEIDTTGKTAKESGQELYNMVKNAHNNQWTCIIFLNSISWDSSDGKSDNI